MKDVSNFKRKKAVDVSLYKKAIVEEADNYQMETKRAEDYTDRISMVLKTPERCLKKHSPEISDGSDT